MSSLFQDIRYAGRQLARNPGFAVAAILTLSLGIGANTAIFSVVNGLLLRPPGGIQSFDELVSVYTSDYSGPAYSSSSFPDVTDFASARGLSGVAAYGVAPVILSEAEGGRAAELVLAQPVTRNYFDVLGALPAAGRTFAPGEGGAGGRRDVVVLGHAFWQSRYGGDPRIVGSAVRIGGVPYTVIGIASPEFRGLLPGLEPAFWVPIGATGVSDPSVLEQRGDRGLFVIGRLAQGATIEQVRAQLQSVARALHRAHPEAWTDV
ncbi:MAG TPA: ABC transporter permease, partial [Longimicrobiales bacterium]|nr:ABC transporter permease [Longimicrobiales bacterium]